MIVMVVNCVTNYMPFRENLYSMIFDVDEIPQSHNYIITGLFYSLVIVISIVFPKITSILGIFGGLTSTVICYIIPCKPIIINNRV